MKKLYEEKDITASLLVVFSHGGPDIVGGFAFYQYLGAQISGSTSEIIHQIE